LLADRTHCADESPRRRLQDPWHRGKAWTNATLATVDRARRLFPADPSDTFIDHCRAPVLVAQNFAAPSFDERW